MPKSIFEADSEKITSEYNVAEDWQGIMDFCDKLKSTPNSSKDALKCIMKRVNHPIPHVAMQALTLLAACVDNCGKPFHLEICSREWTGDAKATINRSHGKVSEKLRGLVQKWAESFKDDSQLNLMVQFYKKLKADGFTFESAASASAMSSVQSTSQVKDEVSFKEDLDLAIAMSLQENTGGASGSGSFRDNAMPSTNLYPAVTPLPEQATTMEEREVCQVRALYDFEAAEDNEMTFKAGEIFSVLDNSDENWWKGRNTKGVGLFPANFVTTDLVEKSTSTKKVHFELPEASPPSNVDSPVEKIKISDEKLDLTLSMLKNASPNDIDEEEETICTMEKNAVQMGTLIDKKVLSCDYNKEKLEDVNEKFLQALALYQQLMKEPVVNPVPTPVQPYQMMAAAAPQHSLQYQQQMLAHSLGKNPQHISAPLDRGYSSLPPVSSHHIDADAAYHGQGASGIVPHQLSQQQQKQIMMQSPPSFSAPPASLPHQTIPGLSLSQQPASLPMQVAAQLPLSHMRQQEYASIINYNQQQFNPGENIQGVPAVAGPPGELQMNYGYIPKSSVYQ